MSRHVTAGSEAAAHLEALLGLEENGWRLEGLCVEGGAELRLRLASGEHRLIVRLRARGEGLAAAEEGGPAQRRLSALLTARLKNVGFQDVAARVDADPDSFAEEVDPAAPGGRVRVPYVAGPMSLLESGWRNFFADQDFEILLQAPEPALNKTVTVEYADLECFTARPDVSFSQWSFLDWPDESLNPEATGEDSFVGVELEERDMVMGTGEKADALVSEVKRLADAGSYLVVTHLCTPIVMGEDFSALARRCEKEACGTSVSWSQKDRDRGDNFGEHIRSVLGRPGFFDGPGDAGAVNLFHFPAEYRERELAPLLAELGLTVNVRMFPLVDFPSIEALPKARWQAFCEKPAYSDKALELLRASPRPVIISPAPYGVGGTRACARTIAAAAGKEPEFEAAWARRLAAFGPSWEELRREAAGHRLAFVVSEATLPRLLAARYGHGAPLAAVAREMGFGLDLIYYERHGEAPALPEGLRDARVKVFRTPAELDKALAGGASAVYSDIFFDWRVSRAGAARFSAKDFGMGLEGARRGLERLLAACRTPFYRRYARHLARTPRRIDV